MAQQTEHNIGSATAEPRPASVPLALQSLLSLVVDALPEAIAIFDEHWRIAYANPIARRISRIGPEDINRLTHWELYPETLGTPIEAGYRRAMDTREQVVLEPFFYQPFDTWYSIRVIPVERGVALYYRDVTEQKRSRDSLREAEDRLRLALMTSNGIGTWDWDVPNDLVYADRAFASLYGVDPIEAAAGTPIEAFTRNVHPEDLAPLDTAIRHALATGAEFAAEYRLLRPGGDVAWVSARGHCVLDSNGKPLRFPGITFDITSRKRTEAALLQSEKLAAVGRMASSIAHEINNPLESVTNLIYIARQHNVPQVQPFLDLADQELRRVSIIANQTLRFHKQASSPQAVAAADLFATVLSIYEGRLRNSGIQVTQRNRAHRPIVCFEGEIRQVLNNLVGNAIDAMPTGGRLFLRSREATDWPTARKGLVLTVADTGAGMDANTQARIFEAFFTTKGFGGSGLGLWISTEIMDRHNGRLRLRSTQRATLHGTVFTLFLPFDRPTPATAAQA